VAARQPEPGFWRRFRIAPAPGRVYGELEDDFHCMSVDIAHDGRVATAVHAGQSRAPWSTCPGAVEVCERTFTGIALAEFPARVRVKAANCTHLFDLAVLAAAHARDTAALQYDIRVADPVGGERSAVIYRDGEELLAWRDAGATVVAPAAIAGTRVKDLDAWIATLAPPLQEAAKLLRRASLIAHGRTIPMARQSDASRLPPVCYSFQPERAVVARRIGASRDFSVAGEPLDGDVVTTAG